MDAISLLKQDHKRVKELFKQVEELSDRAAAARRDLFAEIDTELSLHARIEEELFYPAVKERSKRNDDTYDLVNESFEEHAIVKELIAQLEDLDPKDEQYKAKLTVMRDLVEQHVKEEERELFPSAKELLGSDELKALGERITQMKQQAGAAV